VPYLFTIDAVADHLGVAVEEAKRIARDAGVGSRVSGSQLAGMLGVSVSRAHELLAAVRTPRREGRTKTRRAANPLASRAAKPRIAPATKRGES
jgi:hypothetical protein